MRRYGPWERVYAPGPCKAPPGLSPAWRRCDAATRGANGPWVPVWSKCRPTCLDDGIEPMQWTDARWECQPLMAWKNQARDGNSAWWRMY